MVSAKKITVKWDSEWEQYVVKMGRSTYETNDYEDALGTAEFMMNRHNAQEIVNRVPKSKRK